MMMENKRETIVLGGGCFWCTEAVFSMFDGVLKTTVGYAGGKSSNPDYWSVAGGRTGHAEVCMVEYDPEKTQLNKILDIFFKMHDPTTPNRQMADIGTEYRSIILYTTQDQKDAITLFIKELQKRFARPIVTEVKKLEKFYPAEEEHQKYFEKNPINAYCIFVIRPKVGKIKKEFGIDK